MLHIHAPPPVICVHMTNKSTILDRYSFSHLQNLTTKKTFSKLDRVKAYSQIVVAEEDIPKTAFVTPFGKNQAHTHVLRNAAQTVCIKQRTVSGRSTQTSVGFFV